jgi:hypothetical protein
METATLGVEASPSTSSLRHNSPYQSFINPFGVDLDVLKELGTRYSLVCIDCICISLASDELRVIHSQQDDRLRNYCALARMRAMSDEELSELDHYRAKPEFENEFRSMNLAWLRTERGFLILNLEKELGRPPRSSEVEDRLADELLKPGRSHSRRFRVYFALTHPNEVEKTCVRTDYAEAFARFEAERSNRIAARKASELTPALAVA